MALTVDVEIKQNYDLEHVYVKDNTTYDPLDRDTAVTQFTIELWDWDLGVDPDPADIVTYRLTDADPNWSDWVDIRLGFFIPIGQFRRDIDGSNISLFKINDGAYNIRTTITYDDGGIQSDFVTDVYGFHQEVRNEITKRVLAYDWKTNYQKYDPTNQEIVNYIVYLETLELSITPASLVENFIVILNKLRRMLDIIIPTQS